MKVQGFGPCYFRGCKAIAFEMTTIQGEDFPHCDQHCIDCSTWGGISKAQIKKMKAMKEAQMKKAAKGNRMPAKELDQATLLRKARAKLKKTNAELAESLGVSEATMLAWLAPKTSGKHRNMPRRSRMLLAAILTAGKK